MRIVRTLLVVCIAASLIAVAQEKKPAEKAKPAAAGAEKRAAKPPAGMPDMKPSPEIQKLAKMLVGTYSTKETHEPGPFMPKGGTGVGEARFMLGPGGNSVIENYQSKSSAGGKFRGHGVSWYDAKAGGYRGLWCDNMSPACDTGGVSKWEGDKLVGTSESEMMGKKMTIKGTMSDFSPNGFKYTMETSVDGGPMQRTMVIDYVRAAGGEKAAAEKEKK